MRLRTHLKRPCPWMEIASGIDFVQNEKICQKLLLKTMGIWPVLDGVGISEEHIKHVSVFHDGMVIPARHLRCRTVYKTEIGDCLLLRKSCERLLCDTRRHYITIGH
jgi:hypothetical protein